jgi:hypothetical protein
VVVDIPSEMLHGAGVTRYDDLSKCSVSCNFLCAANKSWLKLFMIGKGRLELYVSQFKSVQTFC